jgi:hypothetical protein
MTDYATAGRLLERMAAAWVTFDGDAWVDLFTPDAVLVRDPAAPALIGTNALRAELLAAAEIEEQVEFAWERHWVVPPTILAPWRMSYVHRQHRALVSLAGFAVLEIADDGRIARSRWWHYRHETPVTG